MKKTLKWTSKPNLVAICKNKFTLTLNKHMHMLGCGYLI